jgi:hypothetical protein
MPKNGKRNGGDLSDHRRPLEIIYDALRRAGEDARINDVTMEGPEDNPEIHLTEDTGKEYVIWGISEASVRLKGEKMDTKLDWKRIEKRTISVGDLIKLAHDLRDEDGSNVEYERGLVELVCDAAGLSMGFKESVAKRIGLKCKVT